MLSILGVHAGVYLTSGGFFLLDSFFALSGFLITSFLIVEWRRGGTIRLGSLLGPPRPAPVTRPLCHAHRRLGHLRRLRPAGTYPTLRGDALAALFYFANWHFISLVQLFPHDRADLTADPHLVPRRRGAVLPGLAAVFLGVVKFRRSLRACWWWPSSGALAPLSEMALLFNPEDINRLYFGTDTHAQSVLVGATLAVGPAPVGRTRGRAPRRTGRPARPGRATC